MITNPILPGFHADPSILRVEDCYYIANSSFEWTPGIPIYRSYDLKHWQLYTHVITRKEQADLTGLGSALGVWAPSLSYDAPRGIFYVTYSVVRGCAHNNFDVDNYVVESSSIKEGWSDAIYLNSSGFDPSLFHDTDGRSYLVNLEWEFREGYEHPGCIVLQEFDKKKKELVGEIFRISKGATDRGCLEGPNLYKKKDYYYLVTAEGGTGYGHCVAVSRARKIIGPYETYSGNPIITSQPHNFNERGVPDSAKPWQYNKDSLLQKSGHGSIVETPNGEVYIAHLCSRPFVPELRSTLGRETALQKCEWTEDGWIKMQGNSNLAKIQVEEPCYNLSKSILVKSQEREELENKIAKVQRSKEGFYFLRDYNTEDWLKFDQKGNLYLRGRETLFSCYKQSLIAKKVTSFQYEATVKIAFEPESYLQMAGLVNYYNASAFYYLRVYWSDSLGGKTLGIMKSDGGIKKEYRECRVLLNTTQESLYLRCQVQDRLLKYAYSYDGSDWHYIGPALDITILSDEYAKGFTGSFVGVSCQDLYRQSKWCRVEAFKLIGANCKMTDLLV